MPPRPTVRESFRRGLFVRLPTEGEAEEGLAGAEPGAEEQSGQGLADQYPEQVADPYPGWRQAADGSWEAVSAEAYSDAESAEPAAPAPYPEIDQSANFASVAGGEPFSHEEAGAEVPAWTFAPEQEAPWVAAETVVPVTPQPPEIVSGVMPEAASELGAEASVEASPSEMPQPPEPAAEVVPPAEAAAEVPPEVAAEVPPEPAAEVVPPAEAAASAEPVPDAAPEPVAEVAAAPEPVAEVAAAPEAAAEVAPATVAAQINEDPVAGTDLYIPSDVELLEGDMPVYGEKENVPPRFAGSGLGEPFFIEFGDLARTLTGLRRLLPKGTRLTYNYDYERAWVRTSVDIDLPSFAERIEAPAAEGSSE